MRSYIFGFIGLVFAAQASALSLNDISQNQAGESLKTVLEQSTRLAVEQLSQPGGFNKTLMYTLNCLAIWAKQRAP